MARKFAKLPPTAGNVRAVRKLSRHIAAARGIDPDDAESDAMLALARGRLGVDRPLLWLQVRSLTIDGWRARYGRHGQRRVPPSDAAATRADVAGPVDTRSEAAGDAVAFWADVDQVLTPWEQEAARKLADGWLQVDLARHFGVSEATITHRVKKLRAVLARRATR